MKKYSFIIILIFIGCFITSCSNQNKPFKNEYPTQSKVGYYAEYLGECERNIPEVKDEGIYLAESTQPFPTYGKNIDLTEQEKQLLLKENAQLESVGLSNVTGCYDSMDEAGNLYYQGHQIEGRKLYKHLAANGMYYGDVSDAEKAIIKKITYQCRTYGNHLTGLYAPAGEVISFSMSKADFAASGGIKVIIGQALSNDKANNIWLERNFNRMPIIVNGMNITESTTTLKVDEDGTVTGYAGSFLGGPIYLKPMNAGASFSITITGGVRYAHYILGATNEEEYEQNVASSAPFFDLEVWDRGVRHSGPKIRAEVFNYHELYQAARFWENAIRVSTLAPSASSSGCGIDFIYDCFVAAGAAVAFPQQSTSVNCPDGWLTSALNYEQMVTSGSWGNLHEMNHHFQANWGMTNDGEVSNNALTLITYSLYTQISANRNLEKENEGLSGWNCYTSASWSLNQLINGRSNDLAVHATMIHNIGQDLFLKAAGLKLGRNTDQWFKALVETTGYDMTYYFTEICGITISESMLDWVKELHLPMFLPVASIYGTGMKRTDGKEVISFTSMQPYEIEQGESVTFDFSRCLVLPKGVTAQVKGVTQPRYGHLVQEKENYIYTPDASHDCSGTMEVTLELATEDGAYKQEVILVLELKQGAYQPMVLDKITYSYEEGTLPDSLEAEIASGFEHASNSTTELNLYDNQNGNAQVWFPKENTITHIAGKLYISADGKYRLSFRGRRIARLELSLDQGNTYTDVLSITETDNIGSYQQAIEASKYIDYDLSKGDWIYFKAYVLNKNEKMSFLDIAMGQFNEDTVNVFIVQNAYRPTYEKPSFDVVENVYEKVYPVLYDKNYQQDIIASEYEGWDESFSIDKLVDEDPTNFIHSNKTDITVDHPFSVTMDLGEAREVNTLTIYGEPTRAYYPKDFILYAGLEQDQLEEVVHIQNAEVTNHNSTITFSLRKVRYYQLLVTDTYASGPKYIALRGVKLSLQYKDMLMISPDSPCIEYQGSWQIVPAFSNYGHVYVGDKKATIHFKFKGTQFAIYTLPQTGNYGIWLDGIQLDRGTESSYISSVLADANHEVCLKGLDEHFYLDAIALHQTGEIEEINQESNPIDFTWYGLLVLLGVVLIVLLFAKLTGRLKN